MNRADKIQEALTLVIPNSLIREMNRSDLDNLVSSYAVMEASQKSLIKGEITPDEYCHLCEMHNINVDSYTKTIEQNLIVLGAI